MRSDSKIDRVTAAKTGISQNMKPSYDLLYREEHLYI